MSVVVAGRIARAGRLADGWLEVAGDRIADAGPSPPPRAPDVRHEGIVAPGLFDLQVNGAGGVEVTAGHSALDAIDSIQLEHGVTSYLPTIISTDDAVAERCVAEIAERAADPSSPVAGVHLEGPFLSPAHAGIHAARALRAPADGIPDYVWSDAVRLVTIAPELPGAIELVERLRARGVAVAIGHSGASAALAERAIEAGARLVTHVFNAMSPLHHRDPGLAGVALTDSRVAVTVIPDGVHVDRRVLEIVRRAAGPRVVLVSDATPAAAAPAGRHRMAGLEIQAAPGGGALTADGTLAGSSIPLDAATRSWAAATEATLPEALAAAAEGPARALGIEPGLWAGLPADVVLLDGEGTVERVMRRGRWLS